MFGIIDKDYPKQLMRLESPPLLLFVRGPAHLLAHRGMAAVIGTREPSELGIKINEMTTAALCAKNMPIVSGLALGHDTIAHQGALRASIPTIAVLPDIKNITPSVNTELASKILEAGGVLVSENTPGSRLSKGDFIKRDRIQSGLCQSVFCIESSITGGSMHAVHAAQRMSIPVYVPDYRPYITKGIIDSNTPTIAGICQLIEDGMAVPYTRRSLIDSGIESGVSF